MRSRRKRIFLGHSGGTGVLTCLPRANVVAVSKFRFGGRVKNCRIAVYCSGGWWVQGWSYLEPKS